METTLFADDGPGMLLIGEGLSSGPKGPDKPFCGHKQGLGSAAEGFHRQLGKAPDVFQPKREHSLSARWNAEAALR